MLSVSLFCATALGQSSWGLAVAGDGTIVFCDIERDRVWRFVPGKRREVLLEKTHCHNLAGGYDGRVYFEDVGGESRGDPLLSVVELAPDGTLRTLTGPAENPDPSIWIVRDAAGNGYAWQAESGKFSRILRRSPAGEVEIHAGSEWGHTNGPRDAAQFGQLGGMAVTPGGVLYVSDSGHLRRVLPSGEVETLARNVVGTGPGGLPGDRGLFNHSMGVAVFGAEGTETVYVVDRYRRNIVAWSTTRGPLVIFRSRGLANAISGGGWGWFPTGVAATHDGIYVMESWPLPSALAGLVGSPRIFKLEANGHTVEVVRVASLPLRGGALTAAFLLAAGAGLALHRRRKKRSRVRAGI